MSVKIPRIRRKIALIISVSVFMVILLFYFLINQSITSEKVENLKLIANQIKLLERGLDKHHAEVGEIKKQINTIQIQSNKDESQINQYNQLDTNEMVKESVINADMTYRGEEINQCNIRMDVVPTPDIQMLEVYNSIPFDNPDGGVWKQGWRLDYDPHEWNDKHKLNVFIVPHSHNDPGWIKTYDEYYEQTTKAILTNMLAQLTENVGMTFIWAEISYFSRWYEKISSKQQNAVKLLLKRGQLEFVSGGWVMPDEANAHWLGILQQLTEGQTWLKNHLNVTPTSSWSIDPFGHSAVMPQLLKAAGFQNHLIQRVHYSIKKHLARKKDLEFNWRQLWDSSGESDLFTHLMPFYSYDVPHTCGPDPKVCCQFDFKRLPGYGLTCPWHIPPQIIDETNVAKKAELIIDQWRKKSTLYHTKSVLIPLGDDFRYSQSTEWKEQRSNYEKLFDYINNEPKLHVKAKFGTLQEYFDSVHSERALSDFSSLSGDFFTYADREDHYWSGYFTSRPFHKRLDRVLMTYLRSAEMLYAWMQWDAESELDILLSQARQALSLFQHHDGIAGTARDHVVLDYARQMNDALKACKFVIQQCVYRFLTKPSIYQPDYKYTYFNIDDSRTSDQNDNRHTIILGDEIPTKHVVLHNSLPYFREELVEFLVSKPFVMVTDMDNVNVPSQITPVWSWHKSDFSTLAPQASTTKYKLAFRAKVPPMGLATYMIHSTANADESIETNFAKITILTESPFSVTLQDYPSQVEFAKPREVSMRINDGPGASFSRLGILKAMSVDSSSENVPVHVEFLRYGARRSQEMSGAYLFLPDGPAVPLVLRSPAVLVIRGALESSVTTGLPFAIHENVLRGGALEIRNLVDIRNMDNSEIIMRVSTGIKNHDNFYTDLNGLQVIKRQRLQKLPLQANYYPIPSHMYIEDDNMRLTLLTGQPLGGSSLDSGQLEIMQDRRLKQDDNRGLGQGVLDNQPVLNMFRLVLENVRSCSKSHKNHPSGFLTVNSNIELKALLHPMEKLIWHENDWVGVLPNFGAERESLESDIEVAVLRNLPHVSSTTKTKQPSSIGLVVHRSLLNKCSTDSHLAGVINIRRLLNIVDTREIHSAPITLLKKQTLVSTDEIDLCPMDIKSFIIHR